MPKETKPMLLGQRTYLVIKAMESGCTFFEAEEAVATTMLSHPTTDPVLRTYFEWEALYNKKDK